MPVTRSAAVSANQGRPKAPAGRKQRHKRLEDPPVDAPPTSVLDKGVTSDDDLAPGCNASDSAHPHAPALAADTADPTEPDDSTEKSAHPHAPALAADTADPTEPDDSATADLAGRRFSSPANDTNDPSKGDEAGTVLESGVVGPGVVLSDSNTLGIVKEVAPVATHQTSGEVSSEDAVLVDMAVRTPHVLGCDIPAGSTEALVNLDSATPTKDAAEPAPGHTLDFELLQQKEIEMAVLLKKKHTLRGEIIALKKTIGHNDNDNPIVVEDLTVDDETKVEDLQSKLSDFLVDRPKIINVLEDKLLSAIRHFRGESSDKRSVHRKRCFKEFLEQGEHMDGRFSDTINYLRREVGWAGDMIGESNGLVVLLQEHRKKLCHAISLNKRD